MIVALLIVLACAVLNRMRGDDRWMPSWLRGRSLYYVAPAIGTVALFVQPWPVALAFGGGYFFWAVFSWGYLLLHAAGTAAFWEEREPTRLESWLLRLPGRGLPLFARMLFVLPGVALVAWLTGAPFYALSAFAFAAASTAIWLWFLRPLGRLDWLRAEIAIGGLWGLLILGA